MSIEHAALALIFTALATVAAAAQAQNPRVPGPGSVWSSRTVDSRGAEGHAETVRVARIMGGRPVYSGEISGQPGHIVESTVGIVVFTPDCETQIPKEQLLPPTIPNQCGWGVCFAPQLGQKLERVMWIYLARDKCELRKGRYRFETTGSEDSAKFGPVAVGQAQMWFGRFMSTSWESHIAPGIGEVHARSSGVQTVYSVVQVRPIEYVPPKPAISR